MKKAFIKALSVLLVLTILATSLPFSALAAEENTKNNQNISTDMGDMSMTATNSFGEMLTDSLSEYTGEQNGEYYISDIEYEGYCALVTFATQQGCTIMVAAYEEDTGRMITSASVDVFAEDTEAFVEFEDELPDYFVLKAFMLDDNAAPLCKAYTCNEMTKVYEDFAATTIDDYDEDKVINLDEDETTNFLVMSDETSTITNDGRTNVLVSYDEETGVYTFGNIDEQITSLKKDDIFYFDNGNVEELTFIKVGAVDIDGTTAYITEAEASLEEVFDVVKIDNEMTSGEFALNEDEELEDGVTYLGCEEVEEPDDEISTFGFDNEHTVTYKHNYKVKKDIKPKNLTKISNDVALTGSIKLNGNFGFSLSGKLKYYISNDFTEIEFTLTPSFVLNVTVEGVGRIEINMLPILCSPCPGVSVGLTPKFIVEASVKATLDATLKFTVGIGYNSDEGFVNKSKKPTFKPELKVEGEIFVGIDLCPKAFIASEKLAKLELTSEIGAKLTSEMSTDQGAGHLCDSCLDGKIFLVGDLTGKLVFGDKTKFEKELSVNFLDIKIKITDFYYSFTMDDFGWLDHCPNSLTVRGKCGKNLEWAYNHQTETLTITGKGKMFDYENDNVPWFDYRFDGIKKIVIGNSVKSIGEYAFYFCGELTMVEIGKGLTEIGDNAFGDCNNLTDVYYSGTKDEWDEIEIGINNDDLINAINDGDDSVTENGTCGKNVTWKFNESTGTLTIFGTGEIYDYYDEINDYLIERPWEYLSHLITTVVIEDGVTAIGDLAFYGCTSLTRITIPDSVTTIGGAVFEGTAYYNDTNNWENGSLYIDNWLIEVSSSVSGEYVIRNGIVAITDSAFASCDNLTSITADSNNQYYSNDEYGVLFNKNKTTLIQYPIGNTRTSYTIPDSVTTIGDFAFAHSNSLTSITIPDSVTSIGEYAFFSCDSLTSVTIPDSVTTIDEYAFAYCESLESVTIPDSVTTIDEYAFAYCESLESVTIPDGVISIGQLAFALCIRLESITVDSNNQYYSNDEYGVLFNKDKTTLVQYPNGNKENSYIIPDSVTSIGFAAFASCDSLTSVTIPDSVTSIGFAAFASCDSLTSVTIPNSVTSIGDYAFSDCYSLTSVTIPDSVTSIGDYAFSDCYSLTSVTIPDSVTTIGDSAFEDCNRLTSVTIPDSVTTIGDDAFDYCYSLTSVTIPDSVTTIGERAFRYCSRLTSIIIPDSVTSIGNYAFAFCDSLKSVTIGDSVTTIGDDAFDYCYSLTSITVDSNNQYYSNDEYGVWFNKNKTTLIQYPIGNTRTSYTIPDSVTSIGNYAFAYCDSLTSVTIPDSVTTTGVGTFYDCDSLKSVTIPDSVTTIGNFAFYSCNSLTSVTLPDSVTTINYNAFKYCDSLTSITIPDSVTIISFETFWGCNSLTDVYYSGSESQWNEIFIGDYNNSLLNATIHYNSTGATYSLRSKQPKLMSFAMAKSSDLTVYNATASNVISGNEYVIVVLNDTVDINNFTNNDLLYIDQKTAETDGNITFNYVPKSDEECIVYIIGIFSDTNSVKQELITPTNPNEPENPDYNFNFYIQQPSRTTIRNKDTIILHAIIDGTVPEGSYIEWDMSEGNFSLGWELDTEDTEVYATAEDKGYDTITAILYDADGNELARDSVELYSKSGFFDKIGGFFRMLFGATKTYDEY